MASGIKIKINAGKHNVNLPRIPFSVAYGFARIGLWSSSFIKDLDEKEQNFITENKSQIIAIFKLLIHELKQSEPFVLVEVVSDEANILIEIL